MKKTTALLVLLVLCFCLSVATFSNDKIYVTIDGEYIEFDVNPQIIDGRTMVPVRTIFEALGADVAWDNSTSSATCTRGNTVVKLKINHMDMYVNDTVVWMDIPAFILEDRLVISARYVAEAFGADVKWDDKKNTVVITSAKEPLLGKIIVVDAGHGKNSSKRMEPVAPGSSETKRAFVSGTSGKRQSEEQLNLSVSLKLQKLLESKGATVYMTRNTSEATLSNVERAVYANNLNADMALRIHADGSDNKSVRGVSVLVPGGKYIKDSALIEKSGIAGKYILDSFVDATGAVNRGISVRNDMTGFNWSEVPVVLVELGFMSNAEEDRLMETSEYQDKMVDGIIQGLEKYFEAIG